MSKFYYIHDGDYWEGVIAFENKEAWESGIEKYDHQGIFCDDGWSKEVENVIAGVAPYKWVEEKHFDEIDEYDFYLKHATHTSEKVNERQRPDDVDEEGWSETDETHWGDWEYICGYDFVRKGKDNE